MSRNRILALVGLAGVALAGFGAVIADPVPGSSVAPRKARSARSAPAAPPVPAELRMYRALQKRVKVQYKDAPLNEVVKDLAARASVAIVADPRGLKDAGVLPNSPISAAGDNVRLATLLDQIVTPLNLDFVVAGDSVRITDRQRTMGDLVTVTYPINDLVMRIENGRNGVDTDAVKDLINSITAAIAPETWDEPDGPGSVSFTDKSNSLVIRQSPDVQREIQVLLARLRQERRFPTVRRPTLPARGGSPAPRIEAPPETPDP